MRFTTRTEYGVVSMIYMARHADRRSICIKEMAEQENYPVAYMEKILQSLKKAKLVTSSHGNRGGYALARTSDKITLKQIIEVLEGGTFDVFCKPEVRSDIVCTHFCLCGIKPVWRKTKQILDEFYDSITLEMLMKNEFEMGHMPVMAAHRSPGGSHGA